MFLAVAHAIPIPIFGLDGDITNIYQGQMLQSYVDMTTDFHTLVIFLNE
jgi:hypothetical protein